MQPQFDAFAAVYAAGRAQVVATELVADLETPVSAFLKLSGGKPWSSLLESVEGGAVRGRYSIIGLKPDLIWRCFGDRVEINREARRDLTAFQPAGDGALASLRALLAESQIELPPEMPPMAAGLVGYLGYDTVRLMERLPEPKQDALGVPDGMFMRPTIMAIFDSVRDTLTLVTPVWPDARVTAEVAYDLARERLADAQMDIEGPVPLPYDGGALATATPPVPVSNTTPERYREMVGLAKEYIAAGDIFQVVLSQRLAVPFKLPPFALYRALRRTNPSPFMVHLDFGGFAIVASSPEILVRLRDGTVTIRPIAGTRPRGTDAADDARMADELLADPKELAEHLMLLDLGRNDVGRVARIGSVKVTEKMIIERYSHVMHIVSNVEGAIRPEVDAIGALSAGFPAGTVSGAPKIRAMEIIHELESEKRGVYGGGMGYFSANGTMDSCIALRTAVVKDGVMYVQAGAGIVADSNPESEHQECLNKARALVRAAEEAVRFARRTNR